MAGEASLPIGGREWNPAAESTGLTGDRRDCTREGVFLLHQFFLNIPRELEDAARVDGCSRLGIFLNVILPLSRLALATLGIFTFIGSWNDFLGPLVFLDSVDHYTLPVGVALFQTSYFDNYGLTLAAGTICTLPVLVVFLLFQRNIIRGIALTGLKE